MIINKKHPDFDEYLRKCKKLADNEDEELAEMEANTERIEKSFGDPATAIYKKYALKLKELQKEYYYLFAEEE